MDDDSLLRRLLILQASGHLDNPSLIKSDSSFLPSPQLSFASLANIMMNQHAQDGMFPENCRRQNSALFQQNNACFREANISNDVVPSTSPLNSHTCLSMNQSASMINPFLLSHMNRIPSQMHVHDASSSSLDSISVSSLVNSLGSISIGSLSRLFSMGTISSGQNLSIHSNSKNRVKNGNWNRKQHGSTNSGIHNAQWSTIPQPRQDSFAQNGMLGPWSEASAVLLGDLAISNTEKQMKSRKKPKDRPKRPLSAYNIFFKEERARILDELSQTQMPTGKIGFQNLAKLIGKRWQELDSERMKTYKEKAEADMIRYKQEMVRYVASQDGNE